MSRALNHARHAMRVRMSRRGTESLRDAASAHKNFAAAVGSVVRINDPVFDETMRRAAEHRAKREHIRAMAAKLLSKRGSK